MNGNEANGSDNGSDGGDDPSEIGEQCFWCDGTDTLTQTVHQEQTGTVWICRNCRRDLEGSSYGGSSYGSPDVEDPGHEDSWSDESDDEEHGDDGPSTALTPFRSLVPVSGG